MQATRQRDTPPELAVRRALHRLGLRYRINYQIPGTRHRADIVIRRAKLAIFIDGCFWHGCPEHGTWPKRNAAWWREKIEGNVRRDRDAIRQLAAAGWRALRYWEHQSSEVVARTVLEALEGEARLVEKARQRTPDGRRR
jgi:DNA mismatch endonuclease (patch repair protein)